LSNFGGRGPVERLAPAPVLGPDVRADAVLCSHAHSDHVDPITLPEIAQAAPDCRFYAAAEGIGKMTAMGIAPDSLQTIKVGDRGLRIGSDVTADVVYASHSGDAVGFVFTVGSTTEPTASPSASDGARAVRLYITGDSLYEPQLVSDLTRNVDVLCVCINGRMGNMAFDEAARLTSELGARVVVPMHFGVMPHNTIDPQLFLDALRDSGATATPRLLAIGETAVL